MRLPGLWFLVLPVALALPVSGDPVGLLEARVSFPTLGVVHVSARGPQLRRGEAAAVAVTRAGRVIARFPFRMGEEQTPDQRAEDPFPVRFRLLDLEGWDTPLIIAVAGSHGGSDASFETIVIGLVDGRLRDLLDPHPWTNIQGAVCLAYIGSHRRPVFLVGNYLWEDDIHYAPHRFEVTRYDLVGKSFVRGKTRITTKKQQDAAAAFAEFGYACLHDFTAELIPDQR